METSLKASRRSVLCLVLSCSFFLSQLKSSHCGWCFCLSCWHTPCLLWLSIPLIITNGPWRSKCIWSLVRTWRKTVLNIKGYLRFKCLPGVWWIWVAPTSALSRLNVSVTLASGNCCVMCNFALFRRLRGRGRRRSVCDRGFGLCLRLLTEQCLCVRVLAEFFLTRSPQCSFLICFPVWVFFHSANH